MKMTCAGSGCAGTRRAACVRVRRPTLDDRHACTRSGRAMHQSRRRTRTRSTPSLTINSHLRACPPSQPPSNWPSPELPPWPSVGLDTQLHGILRIHNPGRLDTRAHDRQQFSRRTSSDCTRVKRACVRMRPTTLDKRHACTRSERAAHQNPHAQPPPPPCSPPRLSTFTATTKLAESRAETLTKCRLWHYSVAWDPSVREPGHVVTRLMTASNFPHAPALAAQG